MAQRLVVSHQQILRRRSMISTFLAKNIISPMQITKLLANEFPNLDPKTVTNDIRWIMKSEAGAWIDDLMKFGYAFQCKTAIVKLYKMEEDLMEQIIKAMRDNDLQLWRLLNSDLRATIKLQVEILGNGPTLNKLRELAE